MKRATWMLATCVAATTAISLGLAQERESGATRRTPVSSPTYFSRKGQSATEESQPTTTGKSATQQKSRVYTLKGSAAPEFPASAFSKEQEAEKRRLSRPLTEASTDEKTTGGHPLAGKSGGIVHANYQSGDQPTRNIKPISATSESDNPFATAAKAVKKSADAPGPMTFLRPPLPEIETKPAQPMRDTFVKPAGFSASSSADKLPATKLPTGPQSPTVTVNWIKRSDINVGQECRCDLVVKNSGTIEARNVVVEANFPATVRVTSTDPKPAVAKESVVWTFDSLPAGEERIVHIKMVPSRRGAITTTASVRFTGMAAGLFTVKEPMLKLAMTGPAEVMVGDPASQLIEISNPGTGVAKNVSVEAWIPAGLEHPRGERLIMDIGALNPGESRKLRLSLTATAGGKQKIRVKAKSDASIDQESERLVSVLAPSLKVVMNGPSLRYVGRNAVYSIKVTNDGSVDTNNVRVVHQLPEGFKFLKADNGGTYNASKRTIGWFVGRVEAGKTVEVKTELASTALGKQMHRAGAISEQGARAETSYTTDVDGTASLIVEIVDLDDPVEVGTETAYEVRVRNAGSKSATNVQIACELPAGVSLITAKGPTASTVEKGLISFGSVKELAPGKTAIYRVHVRGTAAGNHRFRARLASDNIKKPLTYDELTKFYKD